MTPDLYPQTPLTATNAPLTTWLSKMPDEASRTRLRARLSIETLGNVVAWVDTDGWHYQLEAPPAVRGDVVVVDLRVWDAGNMLVFLDRIEIPGGFPLLMPDGTQHKERGVRVDNIREAPLEAARAELARIVRQATEHGRHIKEENIARP